MYIIVDENNSVQSVNNDRIHVPSNYRLFSSNLVLEDVNSKVSGNISIYDLTYDDINDKVFLSDESAQKLARNLLIKSLYNLETNFRNIWSQNVADAIQQEIYNEKYKEAKEQLSLPVEDRNYTMISTESLMTGEDVNKLAQAVVDQYEYSKDQLRLMSSRYEGIRRKINELSSRDLVKTMVLKIIDTNIVSINSFEDYESFLQSL